MSSFSPNLIIMDIAHKGRMKLFEDVLKDNPDLYLILYSDLNSEINRVYQERYDFIWLKYHWDLIYNFIKNQKLNAIQKSHLLSRFAKWYCDLAKGIDLKTFAKRENILLMQKVINLKIENFENLIAFDKRCNENIKRIETSFMRSLKLMNNELKRIKAERNL